MSHFLVQHLPAPAIHRKSPGTGEELVLAHSPHQLVQLQQAIGNSGVRALLARNASTPAPHPAVQRFWGDDEESESGGGKRLDSATDAVSDWMSGDSDSGSGGGGGVGGQSESGGGESESGGGGGDESGGSWLDEITDWFDGDESEQEPTESEDEKSWWDELWSDDESESGESEGGESGDEGGTDEAPREIEAANASCKTEDTIGHGGGKSISLHGLTSSNYNHAAPIPAPFPSSVKVTERKVKVSKTVEQDVFDANGTFDVTFASNPSISLPTVPSGLTPCQEKAVQAFISGPLSAHENDHKAAFETNYDGKFTATVSVNNIKDTPDMRKRAMENPVMTEDQQRANTANAASKALDPWKQTVPGLDCKEPEKKEEKKAE